MSMILSRQILLDSIRLKLVVVLIVVSILPMLVTSQIAASLVSSNYTENVESWLFQITQFFFASVRRSGDEAGAAIDSLAARDRIERIAVDIHDGRPVAEDRYFLDALGFDVFTVRSPDGRMLYSNVSLQELRKLPFDGGRNIYLMRRDEETVLLTGDDRRILTSAGILDVFVGTILDASFIEDIHTIGSLSLTFFFDIDGTFRPVYASSPAASARMLSSDILNRISVLAANPYIDAPGSGQHSSIGVYVPIREGDRLIGAIACSFRIDLGGMPMIGSKRLLWLIFATGLVFAVVTGIFMSGFVTRRIGRLAEGVDAVAQGNFTQRIPVRGDDELDRLGIAFNLMAAQLQDCRQLQARLRRKERFATLGEVAAGFAHEVRNPLGIIKTTAELVQRSPRIDEKEVRRLGYVADEVRRIDRLIRDFLIFARPAQRSVTLRPAEIVERVLGFCQSEIEARGVALRVSDEAGATRIEVDLDQMVQAILNLVLNALDALDAVPEGERRLLFLLSEKDGAEVSFALSDNGPGIPPDLLERIFDPFVTTKTNGTGLGLATVFAIVESHGGWIEARNGEGGGAVFELTLPVKAPPGAEIGRQQAHAARHPDR